MDYSKEMRQVFSKVNRNLSNTNMQTDASTMVIGRQTVSMDKERSSGRVAQPIQVNSKTTKDMVRVSSHTQISQLITEDGLTISETAEEYLNGRMEVNIKENLKTIK